MILNLKNSVLKICLNDVLNPRRCSSLSRYALYFPSILQSCMKRNYCNLQSKDNHDKTGCQKQFCYPVSQALQTSSRISISAVYNYFNARHISYGKYEIIMKNCGQLSFSRSFHFDHSLKSRNAVSHQEISSKCLNKDLSHVKNDKLDNRKLNEDAKIMKLKPEENDNDVFELAPRHSSVGLILDALLQSKDYKANITDIYSHIMKTHPYYKKHIKKMKNRLRLRLSQNSLFIHIPKSETEPSYWKLDTKQLDFVNGFSSDEAVQGPINESEGPDFHFDGRTSKLTNQEWLNMVLLRIKWLPARSTHHYCSIYNYFLEQGYPRSNIIDFIEVLDLSLETIKKLEGHLESMDLPISLSTMKVIHNSKNKSKISLFNEVIKLISCLDDESKVTSFWQKKLNCSEERLEYFILQSPNLFTMSPLEDSFTQKKIMLDLLQQIVVDQKNLIDNPHLLDQVTSYYLQCLDRKNMKNGNSENFGKDFYFYRRLHKKRFIKSFLCQKLNMTEQQLNHKKLFNLNRNMVPKIQYLLEKQFSALDIRTTNKIMQHRLSDIKIAYDFLKENIVDGFSLNVLYHYVKYKKMPTKYHLIWPLENVLCGYSNELTELPQKEKNYIYNNRNYLQANYMYLNSLGVEKESMVRYPLLLALNPPFLIELWQESMDEENSPDKDSQFMECKLKTIYENNSLEDIMKKDDSITI